MGMESILGLMEGAMRVNGNITKCTAMVLFSGKMEDRLKALMLRIKKKGMVSFLGPMEKDMKGIGKKVNSMELENW